MNELKEILQASVRGPAALREWMQTHTDQVTVDLADAVYAQAKPRLEAGRLNEAAVLYFTAMTLYRTTGPQEQALRAAFNYLQCTYMAAETVPAYEDVRTKLLTIGKHAANAHQAEIAFNCFVVAADSAFCAADLSQGAADWVFKSLGDLRNAAGVAAPPLGPAQLQLYTNVVANLWVLARKADWGTNAAAAEGLLGSLAAEAERLVPIGFTLPNDPQKTQFVADNLADLSDEYGNPNNAGTRRAAAHR